MTKKECIWLGVRIIGLYFLLIALYYILMMLIAIPGSWLVLKSTSTEQANFALTFISYGMSLVVPILLAVYFLFFGKLIYKLIYHYTRSSDEDFSQSTGYGYCEIVVRFTGLWLIYMTINRMLMPLINRLHVALMYMSDPSKQTQSRAFEMAFRHFFNLKIILISLPCLLLAFLIAWYFLKHGKFFINLLNRLWLKATGKNTINPD